MGNGISKSIVRLAAMAVVVGVVLILGNLTVATAFGQENTGTTTLTAATAIPAATCGKPTLNLNQLRVYWASYADYTAGMLSDDFRVDNSGPGDALTSVVNGTINTGGVTAANIPIQLGTITEGGSVSFTVEYMIPQTLGGGQVFRSTIYIFAGDACYNFYNYPEPYPGPCG